MAAYRYKALDATGRLVHGNVEAASERAARHELRQQALIPLKIDPPQGQRTTSEGEGVLWQ